jgi:predicted secreted protein
VSLPLSISVYFTLWWITLFAILPFGVRSQSEEPTADVPAVADKGAPIAPMLLKKAVATTLVSAVIFALVDAYAFWMA